MTEKKDVKYTIGFKSNPEKPTIPVGGAWGGPSPDGSVVVAHVFVESFTLPNYLTYQGKIIDGGKVKINAKTEERVTMNDITREVQATLVMTPEVAMSFATFLKSKAQSAFRTRKEGLGADDSE